MGVVCQNTYYSLQGWVVWKRPKTPLRNIKMAPNKPLKNLKNLELRDYFYLFLILKNVFVYFYFISIEASIRNELSHDIFLKFLLSLLWSLRSEDNYGWSLRFWRSFFSFSGKTALNLENVRQVSVKIYKKYHEKIKFLP